MKPSPRYDFPLSVRRQTWEEEAPTADFYEGIFDVSLNHSMSVMFVPSPLRATWPPAFDERVGVSSPDQARERSLALSPYAVTSDDALAGRERTFAREWTDGDDGVILYVTEADFAIFTVELARLADERPSVRASWDHAEIAQLAVTRFLVERLLRSPAISTYDLKMLGR